LDDVYIGEAPVGVPIVATAATQTAVRLEWEASTDPDFAAYRISRALGTNAEASAFTQIAEISDLSTTSWTDIAVSPKSIYTYALSVMNTHDLESPVFDIPVITPAGMDYPFLDNAEGGGGLWVADAPWGISTSHSFSADSAWSDSPDGNYTNQVNASLTLVTQTSLHQARHPVLCYAHRYELLAGDVGLVELSTNNGAAWISLASYTAGTTGWLRVRHDLTAYTNASQVLVRFRLTTDANGTADGWWVDDITLSEAPDAVDALLPVDITSDAMRIPWTANTNNLFMGYLVVRSTNTGVGLNSQAIASIEDQGTTSYPDSGLSLDTEYYYRVYAV
ncbi:MAG: fibronectin type III domain-containing protein, partial [Kiritimatiellae bacterium]|nr:fibronectin type III domain-containing protein [Kiritimatiellia bacterium]